MDKQVKQSVKTSVLKCGKRTFFFDVNKASNNKNYLKITESAFVNEAGDRKRSSFLLFPEDFKNFQVRLQELESYLAA